MPGPTQLYRFINILSLDIVAGAVLCALFFSSLLDVRILPYGLISLALTVWVIYTADHLRDARKIRHRAATPRHQFHQRHFRALSIALIIVVAIDSIIILFMRKPVLIGGTVLAAAALIYLIIQRYLKVLKEWFVASIYTCGVLLPSVSVTPLEISHHHIALFIQFAILAWINLLIFSWYDYEKDHVDYQPSFATISGRPVTAAFIWSLSALNFLVALVAGYDSRLWAPALIFCAMNILLLLVFIGFRKQASQEMFRWLGDSIFFIPGLYWIWTTL